LICVGCIESFQATPDEHARDGKVLAAALEAKKRGVLVDLGHGGGSFDYAVCEVAL